MASFSLHENAPLVILMIHAGAISHAHVGSASVLVGDIDDALDSEKASLEEFAHTNPLHLDVFKSVACFEAEVVAMTAALLGSKEKNSGGQICGNMTPSGTEFPFPWLDKPLGHWMIYQEL
ncbi:Sphingosine-1-phosphate lyase [Glycine soja]